MKIHAWGTLLLTILLAIAAGMFSVPDYNEVIRHPQFGDLQPQEAVIKLIVETGNNAWYQSGLWWYKCYFILDFIWAAFLLSYLYRRVRNSSDWLKENPLKVKGLPRLLFLSAIAAYLLDVCENIIYLMFLNNKYKYSDYFSYIVDFKVIAYTIVFLLVVIFLYQKFVFGKLTNVRKAIQASFLSILAILLLAGLSILMDQGSTVIIHLLENPMSLLAAIILINLIALISAHYPDYLDKYFSTEKSNPTDDRSTSGLNVKWEMSGLFGKKPLWGMGLITYKIIPLQVEPNKIAIETKRQSGEAKSAFFDHFRKITGIMVLMTWIYVLLFVMVKYKVLALPLFPTTLVLLGLFLVLYFLCYEARQFWRRHLNENSDKIEINDQPFRKSNREIDVRMSIPPIIRFNLNAMLISFVLLVVSIGVTVSFASQCAWIYTWKVLMITAIINTIFIIQFQHFRTVYSMDAVPGFAQWIPVYYLSDDKIYVRFFAIMGIITLAAFVISSIQPARINALVFILMYIYIVYGFIVVLMKHHLYYSQPGEQLVNMDLSPIAKVFFEKYVPVLGLILIVWILYTGKAGNGLHVLHPINEEENKLVTVEEFKNRLHAAREEYPDSSVFFIASYGGGLRASAWTMLLLDTLQKSKAGFFDRTAAMSGVSGGFLGLSMYSSILAEHATSEDRMRVIDRIGKHNILSIDIAYLLGFDFIRELIPYRDSFWLEDRAGRSMQEYASLIESANHPGSKLLKTGYREYWSSLFTNPEKHFLPVLIGNSTATHSRFGISFSLQSNSSAKPTSFDSIFPGGVDMLEIYPNKSISYLDATSTVERFPIFSPTAQISKKGHFLDGGYFENSGLLSLINFHDYLKKDSLFNKLDSTTKIIVFINSKDAYIRKVIGDTIIVKNELATGEMGAILSTVADVDILPLALEAKYKQQFGENFIPVYLPYPITYDDVVALIRGTPAEPLKIQDQINASNEKISALIEPYEKQDKFPVPPALARVLSDPAYEYMKAMLRHQEVRDAIALIK